MTTTSIAPAAPAKKATAAKPAPKPAAKKAPAQKPEAKATPTKKVAASNQPAKVEAADLAGRLTAARDRGFTCRALAQLTLPTVELKPGSDAWRLAGRIDRLSRGGSVTPDELKLLVPVLDQIEAGKITPPERTTATRKPSNRSAAITLLEALLAEKTPAAKDRGIREALDLLGATSK